MPREDDEHKGHKYLCSNPNCKKVFSRPKIIKYQVCPACQTLVNMAEAENQGEIPISFAPKKSVKLKKKKKVKRARAPPVQHTKTLEVETVSKSSSNCQYGFGNLNQRRKDEEIPDACMECPKLLNCMLPDQYTRARMAEIKKWYAK